MKSINKSTVGWNGLLPVIAKAVATWRPPKLRGELAYRNALFAHLRARLPEDSRLEKEYRHRGTTMDLWLHWKGIVHSDDLSFELKHNLKKKADYDRLVGQIESLEPKKNKVLVVLIGESDSMLLGRLQERYREQMDPLFQMMAIVEVEVAAQ